MIDEAVLSHREQEILRLVATGAGNKEIALKLLISPNTVKVHLRNIFTKIGAVSRTEATLYAIRHGIAAAPARLPVELAINANSLPGSDRTTTNIQNPSLAPFNISSQDNGKIDPGANSPVSPAILRWRRLAMLAGVAILAVFLVVVSMQVATRMGQAAPKATQAANLALPANRWQAQAALPENVKSMAAVVYESYLFLISGETSAGLTDAVYQYTITTSTWNKKAPKPTPVADVMAVLLGEKIYVPGGRSASGQPVKALEVFDPRRDQWEAKAPLPVAISGYALAAIEGRLYLFGGWDGAHYLNSVYSYDPEQNRWTQRTSMPTARAFAGAAASGGKIFIIGGYNGQQALAVNEVYYPDRDDNGETPWIERAPLQQGSYAMGMTSLAGFIYLVGGVTDSPTTQQALQYIILQDSWQPFENPPSPAGSHPALLALQDQIALFGGQMQDGSYGQHQVYQAIYKVLIPGLQKSEP